MFVLTNDECWRLFCGSYVVSSKDFLKSWELSKERMTNWQLNVFFVGIRNIVHDKVKPQWAAKQYKQQKFLTLDY